MLGVWCIAQHVRPVSDHLLLWGRIVFTSALACDCCPTGDPFVTGGGLCLQVGRQVWLSSARRSCLSGWPLLRPATLAVCIYKLIRQARST